ncbi:predicted protein [Naegleria gruberi]|uniref:Predicted protein n=1 Tax=Naegleria gruberi TaxID=5762 RepID=D2VLI8_NAEGR|nr:uncharacterized protein NAEGRDRAFT_69794 [Naegleria gruberi]EFC42319.1 predicted protein [Naegleria gruberi]|eukprot:XP_002675063.1 predicted protein [Naegleria gruberi strain NEG-M]
MSYLEVETGSALRLVPLSILSIHEYSTGSAAFDSFSPQNSYESSMGMFCMSLAGSSLPLNYVSQADNVKSSQIDSISLQSNKLKMNGKWNGQIFNYPITEFEDGGYTYELSNEITVNFHSLSNTQLNIPITLQRYLSAAFEQVNALDHPDETARTADPSELEYLFVGYSMNSFTYKVSTDPNNSPEWTQNLSDNYALETDIPTLMTYPYYRAEFHELTSGNPLMTIIIKDGVLTMSKKVLGTTSMECPMGSVRNENQHFYRGSTFHYIAYSTIHPMYTFDYSTRNWKLNTQIDVSSADGNLVANLTNFDNTLSTESSDHLVSVTLSDNVLQDYETFFNEHVIIGKPDHRTPISSITDLALLHIDDLGNSISGPLITQEDFRQELDWNFGFCDEKVGSRMGNQLSNFFSSTDYTIEQLPEYGTRLSYEGGVQVVNSGSIEMKFSNHEFLQDFTIEVDQSLLRYKEPKVDWLNFTVIPDLSSNGRNATIQTDSYNSGEAVGEFSVELTCSNQIMIFNSTVQLFSNVGSGQNFTSRFDITSDFEYCNTLSIVSSCNIRISVTRQALWTNLQKELSTTRSVTIDYGYFIPRCQIQVNEPFVWIETMLLESAYFTLNQERGEFTNNILVTLKTNSSQSAFNPTIRASLIPNIDNPFHSIGDFTQIMQQEFVTLNFTIKSSNISRILSERSQNTFYTFNMNLTLLETHSCWSTEGKGGLFPFSFQVLYECPIGYTGIQCDIPICYGLNSTNPNACSGNGNCISPNSCVCHANYTEGNCSIPLCFGVRGDNSEVCSSKGSCVQANVCGCEDGHTGLECEIPKCFNIAANESVVCSGHGDCFGVNNCSCHESYFGLNCELSNIFSNVSNSSLSFNISTSNNETLYENSTFTSNRSIVSDQNNTLNFTESIRNSTINNSSISIPENSNSTISQNFSMDSNLTNMVIDNSTTECNSTLLTMLNKTISSNNISSNCSGCEFANETLIGNVSEIVRNTSNYTYPNNTASNEGISANDSLSYCSNGLVNETMTNLTVIGNETLMTNNSTSSMNSTSIGSNNLTLSNETLVDMQNGTSLNSSNMENNTSTILGRNETLNETIYVNSTSILSNESVITNETLTNQQSNYTSNLGNYHNNTSLNTTLNPTNLTLNASTVANNSSENHFNFSIPVSEWSCNMTTNISNQCSGNGQCTSSRNCSCNDGFSGQQCQFIIPSPICSGNFIQVEKIINKDQSIYLERLMMDKKCQKTIPLMTYREVLLENVTYSGMNLSDIVKLYSVFVDSNGNKLISFDSRLLLEKKDMLTVWRVDSQGSSTSKLTIPINYGIHSESTGSTFGLIKFVNQNNELFAITMKDDSSIIAVLKVDLERKQANLLFDFENELLTFSNIVNGNQVYNPITNKTIFSVIVNSNQSNSYLIEIDLSSDQKKVSELKIPQLTIDSSLSLLLTNPTSGEQYLLSSGQTETTISSIQPNIESENVTFTILASDSDFTISKSDTVIVEEKQDESESKVVILNVDTGISLIVSTNRLVSNREIFSKSSQKVIFENPNILSIMSSSNLDSISLSISSMSTFNVPIASSVQIQIEGRLTLTDVISFIVFKHEESDSIIEELPIQTLNSRSLDSSLYYFTTRDVSNSLPKQLFNSKTFKVKVYIKLLTNDLIGNPIYFPTNMEITMFRFKLENISPKFGFYGNELIVESSFIPIQSLIYVNLKITELSNSVMTIQCKVLNLTHCKFDIPLIESVDTMVQVKLSITNLGLETVYDSFHSFRYFDPSMVNVKDLTHFDISITFPDIPYVNSSIKPLISFIPSNEGTLLLFEMNKNEVSSNNSATCGTELTRQIVGSSDLFNISNSISFDVKLLTFSNIENGNLFEVWISKSQNATFFASLSLSNSIQELTIGQLNITRDSELVKKSVNCQFKSNRLYHLTVLVQEFKISWELKDVELNAVECSAQYSKDNSKLLSNNGNVKGYQVAIGQSFECSQLVSDTAIIPTLALSGMKEVCVSCKILNFLSAEKEMSIDSFLGGLIGGVGGFLLLSLTVSLIICCIIRKKRMKTYNYVYHSSRNLERNQTIQDLFASASPLGASEDFDIIDEHPSYFV